MKTNLLRSNVNSVNEQADAAVLHDARLVYHRRHVMPLSLVCQLRPAEPHRIITDDSVVSTLTTFSSYSNSTALQHRHILLQGDHSFSKMIFHDFSMTFS